MGRREAETKRGAALIRIRALLAGALVLGLGSSVTLASWTDSDFASGAFGASVFVTESNVTKPYNASGTWSANDVAPGAALVFTATSMSPGSVVYAPFALRTKANSVAGEVVLGIPAVTSSGTGTADLGAALRYRVVRSATCDAASFSGTPTFVVGSDGTKPLTQGQAAGVVNPLSAASATLPGTPTQFCFEVTLPAGANNALQGQTATATWQFTATSSS
ncbi:putative ribosomally synthesized peptide with SipW-like signal peptide [Paenarthrobacter nicotinovorans]|uniref:SipW-dependent-type signal peptide-containing protein n=1 Tax=Micrococcaceae TaxID=1268 RepID=UPI000876A453|nr:MULTISPECIES: SipW-dependent-type signal peptide-containing protein [Micrococcaceae]MDR6437871.1 putative ribosomally synthesized peptide with SipW-like signal peptide [Paenarthrobacter nicotinovorans]SCZ64712.1 SipW-cognate class signal peptide [Arthrobacter sp. UNCCL28]